MRYVTQLGKITSTISLVGLLAVAGVSSAQAASVAEAGVVVKAGASLTVQMTPHAFENIILTDPPLTPEGTGICGEAGLHPIEQDTSALHYHDEVRNNVVTAIPDPGYEFAKGIQTVRIIDYKYFPCGDPSMFIVKIDAPQFGRVCDPADKQIILSDTTDKPYYYVIQEGSVIAVAKPDHIIQQDTINVWPIVLSNTPCESATSPAVTVPVQPSPVDQTPAAAPVAPVPNEAPIASVEQPAVKAAEPAVQAAITPPTSGDNVDVDASSTVSSKTELANTGPKAVTFWLGIGMMALAGGVTLVIRRWLFLAGQAK